MKTKPNSNSKKANTEKDLYNIRKQQQQQQQNENGKAQAYKIMKRKKLSTKVR